jgi:hypothetical protein
MATVQVSAKRHMVTPIMVDMAAIKRAAQNGLARTGPNPELTPDPSPRSMSPAELDLPSRPKRRFAPQLVETSRRARRVGDLGPRIADKTDATPHKRDKYKSKKRQAVLDHHHHTSDDGDSHDDGCLLGRAAKKAERQLLRDAVLEAFPNSRARAGGATHFYFKDSGSDTSPETSRTPSRIRSGEELKSRRGSSVDLGWWNKVHREHSEKMARAQEARNNGHLAMPKPMRPQRRPGCAMYEPPENEPVEDPELAIMRRAASPPMAGDDVQFVRCESPETVQIHTDLPWTATAELQKCRDKSEKGGLWKGFCFKTDATSHETTVKCGLWGPKMISTPHPPATPHAGLFNNHNYNMAAMLTPPLTPAAHSSDNTCSSRPPSRHTQASLSPFQIVSPKPQRPAPIPLNPAAAPRTTTRQRDAKALEALEARIRSEFDDAFVSKVYNYLGLGYPVTARDYDDELSRITGMPEREIERDDEKNLLAGGHVCDHVVAETPAERQCPRWLALRRYMHEWARQHPDLEGVDPSPKAWGIKVRGGWAS